MRSFAAAALLMLAAAPAVAAAGGDSLKIVAIDVEGGAAALYITPQGHSLLIDTGWPEGMGGSGHGAGDASSAPDSAHRIAAAARAAGLRRIDYVMVTHYHADHVGAVPELIGLIPIGTFIDHGPNREMPPPNATARQMATATATFYARYESAIAGRRRRVMKAGDTLKIDDLVLTAIDSDGAARAQAVAGAGEPGAGCANAIAIPQVDDENDRSLGVLGQWGDARILSLGDTTWNMENRLVCPHDLIGPVDLMFADNHGSANASSPALLAAVRPTVLVVQNGATKGGDASTYDTAMNTKRLKGLWQIHFATRAPEKNGPEGQIANPGGAVDMRYPLAIAVRKDGTVVMTNPRTGRSTSYPKQPS